jgi:hypothetical protein
MHTLNLFTDICPKVWQPSDYQKMTFPRKETHLPFPTQIKRKRVAANFVSRITFYK